MSVVVRMEMPHDGLCDLAFSFLDRTCCTIEGNLCNYCDDGVIPKWCPILCQLPEGHGRLVDVTKIDFVMFTNEDSTFRCGWNNGVRSVMQHAETIVPAERSE